MTMPAGKRDAFYDRLAAAIARRRQLVGITQAQLSEDIGMTRGGYAQIETGRSRFTVDRLLDIAHRLAGEWFAVTTLELIEVES